MVAKNKILRVCSIFHCFGLVDSVDAYGEIML